MVSMASKAASTLYHLFTWSAPWCVSAAYDDTLAINVGLTVYVCGGSATIIVRYTGVAALPDVSVH